MSSGGPATLVALTPYPLTLFSIPSGQFLCEAWWTCRNGDGHTWRDRSDCLVNTGEPYSIIPPRIRHDLDMVVDPEPAWTGDVPDWRGAPCRVGRVTIWLQPVSGGFRSFSLLALLPRRNVPEADVFVHLGL